MDKKAVTNVEMIIAATIFIFSLVIIIYYINIIGVEQKPGTFLNIIEQNLEKEYGTDYSTVYLTIDNDSACYKIPFHSSLFSEGNIFIKEDSEFPEFSMSDNYFLIKKGEGNEHNFTIYKFPFDIIETDHMNINDVGDCVLLYKIDNYNYSISSFNNIFVLENLTQMNDSYYHHYEELKGKLGLRNKDFAAVVYYGDKKINMTRMKPQVTVSAKQFPVKIIDKTGEIMFGYINLQVW